MSAAGTPTPGPWEPVLDDTLREDTWRIVTSGGPGQVAVVYSHADARLIAAAPDLLRAAREALAEIGRDEDGDWCRNYGDTHFDADTKELRPMSCNIAKDPDPCVVCLLRAAIERAGGGQ